MTKISCRLCSIIIDDHKMINKNIVHLKMNGFYADNQRKYLSQVDGYRARDPNYAPTGGWAHHYTSKTAISKKEKNPPISPDSKFFIKSKASGKYLRASFSGDYRGCGVIPGVIVGDPPRDERETKLSQWSLINAFAYSTTAGIDCDPDTVSDCHWFYLISLSGSRMSLVPAGSWLEDKLKQVDFCFYENTNSDNRHYFKYENGKFIATNERSWLVTINGNNHVYQSYNAQVPVHEEWELVPVY